MTSGFFIFPRSWKYQPASRDIARFQIGGGVHAGCRSAIEWLACLDAGRRRPQDQRRRLARRPWHWRRELQGANGHCHPRLQEAHQRNYCAATNCVSLARTVCRCSDRPGIVQWNDAGSVAWTSRRSRHRLSSRSIAGAPTSAGGEPKRQRSASSPTSSRANGNPPGEARRR